MKIEIGIAGAGFAGAVIARKLAETEKFKISVFDSRDHIAGNCHTIRDAETGIMIHNYGPHIFNTSRQDVWKYVNQWSEFMPFVNRVKAVTTKGVYSMPINLLTINQFFNQRFNPEEAQNFLKTLGEPITVEPKTFEEQALKFLGTDLYENFFYGYTKKQWGVSPTELPASILKRLPVRFNYDDNYYNQKYQGIPVEGYTSIVQKILDHPNIHVELKSKMRPQDKKYFQHVFWSGPIDGYYEYKLGRLRYRTLKFERFTQNGDFQGNPVINYCEEHIPYTRITEHKHFSPWEEHEKTVCFKEYSANCGENDTPYYPLRLKEDMELLQNYMKIIEEEKNLTFIGRLGTYRYLDMHVVIGESLDLSSMCLTTKTSEWPHFSHSPL